MRSKLLFIGLATTLFAGCGSTDTPQPDALGGAEAVTTGGAPATPSGGVGNDATGSAATGGAGTAAPATGGVGAGGTSTGGVGAGAAAAAGTGGALSVDATGGATTGGSGETGGVNTALGGTSGDVTGGTSADVTGGTSADVTGGTSGDVTGGTSGDVTGGTSGDVTGGTSGDATGGGGGTGGSESTTDTIDCTRAGLSNAVDAYIAAIEANDSSLMPGHDKARYTENASDVNVGESLWATAGEVTYLHSIFDTTKCNTFSFVVSSWVEPGETDRMPIVMGVRLKVTSSEVTEVEAIITRDGDWAFDAEAFQRLALQDGEWPIQTVQQTREVIQYPADCYFDAWTEIIDDADVPLTSNCMRLEGSMNGGCTMLGTADDDDVGFGDRHYVIDVEKGSVALIGLFGGDFGGALDVHLFRVVEGLADRIHTATVFHDPSMVTATGWDPY